MLDTAIKQDGELVLVCSTAAASAIVSASNNDSVGSTATKHAALRLS